MNSMNAFLDAPNDMTVGIVVFVAGVVGISVKSFGK